MNALLGFEIFSDEHDRAARKKLGQECGKEGVRGGGDAGKRQRSAMLHAPGEGLHGGSFPDVSEQVACRRRGTVMRQARGNSQRKGAASSDSEEI